MSELEDAPVRMTGNLGGELLRRVRTFKPVGAIAWTVSPEHAHLREANASGELCQANAGAPRFRCRFQSSAHGTTRKRPLEQTQLSLRTPFLDNDLVRTVFSAPAIRALGK